jgi:hypothetical protein
MKMQKYAENISLQTKFLGFLEIISPLSNINSDTISKLIFEKRTTS